MGWSFIRDNRPPRAEWLLAYNPVSGLNPWLVNDMAWSNQWLGREIKRIVSDDDPLAEILLNLWERDLL